MARGSHHPQGGEDRTLTLELRRIVVVQPVTIDAHELGLWIHERHRLAVFDSTIVASALLADCDILWSEDMHDGLVIDGRLTVRNPFRV